MGQRYLQTVNTSIHWQVIKHEKDRIVLKDVTSGRLADCYVTNLPKNFNMKNQLEMYEHRKAHNQYLVELIDAQMVGQRPICSNAKTIKIITEHIPCRMTKIHPLPLGQSIYALCQALKGFQIIFKEFGVIHMESDMFCFTQQGYLKVWMDSDLSSNHPKRPIANSHHLQSSFILSIFEIVQQHLEGHRYPFELTSNATFNNTYESVRQYAQQNKIFIPSHINFIQVIEKFESDINSKVQMKTIIYPEKEIRVSQDQYMNVLMEDSRMRHSYE